MTDRFHQAEHLKQIREIMDRGLIQKGTRVFMIGIGGSSMAGLGHLTVD